MTIKLMASGLIVAVGWFAGGAYADIKKQGYLELCGVIRLLETLKSGILYSRAELYGMFFDFSDKTLSENGFLEELNRNPSSHAGEAFKRAAERLSIDQKIKDVLTAFGDTLGLLDRDTQVERLESCVSFLESEKTSLKETLESKLKSYRYLGALGGSLAAIILF
ncbi:MAG: stage III sporulation protein AB [Eubacteriales bacterium]